MPVVQSPCPNCGSVKVDMVAAYGGRGASDTTSYTGECLACGHKVTELPSNCNGRKDSAIREWNRMARKGELK